MVRTMTIDDYEEVSLLWHKIKGFSIRSIDDSREGVARFLKRNPDSSDSVWPRRQTGMHVPCMRGSGVSDEGYR